jgi:hypothetical protein
MSTSTPRPADDSPVRQTMALAGAAAMTSRMIEPAPVHSMITSAALAAAAASLVT